MRQLIGTYRKWKDTGETFYISDSYRDDDDDYMMYCEAPYYDDSGHFKSDYVLKESDEASVFDIAKYKAEVLLYNI